MVLLLAPDNLQNRTLRMILKLGGHDAHVVNDEYEAINMIKNVPRRVCGLVLGGVSCQKTLAERISMLGNHHICTPIYLVGLPAGEEGFAQFKNGTEQSLNLAICDNDRLLQCLTRDGHPYLEDDCCY